MSARDPTQTLRAAKVAGLAFIARSAYNYLVIRRGTNHDADQVTVTVRPDPACRQSLPTRPP